MCIHMLAEKLTLAIFWMTDAVYFFSQANMTGQHPLSQVKAYVSDVYINTRENLSLTYIAARFCFDVFGTCVNWRKSIVMALDGALSTKSKQHIDLVEFANEWRQGNLFVILFCAS
jgi:hypothetical protein